MHREKGVIKLFIFLVLITFIAASCRKDDDGYEKEKVRLEQYLIDNNYTDIEPTPSGIYHIMKSPGTGPNPDLDDHVRIGFTASLIDGVIYETSYEEVAIDNDLYRENVFYGPVKFKLGRLSIAGLVEGLTMMKEGETAKIIVPSHLAFGSVEQQVIPAYSTLIYVVELLDVISNPEEHEQKLLDSFLLDNNITVEPSPQTGMYHVETKIGAGDPVTSSSTVLAEIKGYLLDGRVFYNTRYNGSEPREITIASSGFLPSILEGMMQMREGGESTIIIPWYSAYGAQGSDDGRIPPFSTIVYDIDIIEVN